MRCLACGTSDGQPADRQGVVAWLGRHASILQVGGAVLVVGLLLVVDVPWGWFLALLGLLAVWELVLWRLSGADPPSETDEGLAQASASP